MEGLISVNNDFEEGLYDHLVITGTDLYTLVSTKIYNRIAPPGTALDYVIFSLVGGGDRNESPSDSAEFVYMVKGISSTGLAAGVLRDAIRDRLHRKTFTVATWTLSGGGMAEASIGIMENIDGRDYYHAGNNYRFHISK